MRLLTHRERQIVRRVADGETHYSIALTLGLSLGSVGAYVTSIYRKLKLQGVARLTKWAIRNGLSQL